MADTNITSVIHLPFVADIPDPLKPNKTIRCFWNIPDNTISEKPVPLG